MNARERYYLNSHLDRLLDWQIRQAEKEMERINRERIERKRRIIHAWKNYRLGISFVIRDNLAVYNRAILSGR